MRFNLFTLLLVVTLTAIVFSCFVNQREINFMESKLPKLRDLGHVLVVDDPNECRAVKQLQEKFGEKLWNVYLPPNHQYQICVAFEEIDSTGYPAAVKSVPIDSGIHRVAFWLLAKEQGDEFFVALDDSDALRAESPWKCYQQENHPPAHNSLPWIDGIDFNYDINQTKKLTEKLELFRFRCNQKRSAATKPGNGILVWVELANAP